MRKAWRASTLTALFAVLVLGGLLAFDRTCLELTVLSSNEKSAMLAQLANEWNRGATVDGRCVQVRVVRKPSGDAERALARGWEESADGPRPDVWTPAASSWTLLLRQHLAARNVPDVLPPRLPSVIQSPLVIAMPKPMAQALGWPDRSIGWSDLLALSREPQGWGRHGHPEWGAFRLGKTNPTVSTSGLHALIAAYFEATGRLPAETDLSDPKVADFVRGLEASVVHYSETVATFFLNLREADRRGSALSYVSAIAVEEKEVWDYNRGVISGDVADPTPGLPPRVPLVAMYPPLGTLVADHPYAVLDVPWMTEEKRRVAAAFLRFLESAPTQERFASAAFRDHLGQPGAEISEANGLLAREPSLALRPPAPRVIDRIQRSWSDLRKRARVIIAIDESEAMGERLPSGETKLELVRRAALEAVGQLAVDDEVGLWSFATRAGTAPYRELVAVGRAGAQLGLLMRPRRYLPVLALALGVAAIAGLAGVPSWHALLAAAAIVLFRVGLELVPATRTVASGPALAAGGASAAGRLTTRETEIAVLVGEGMTNREIAARLVISERTVDNHVHNILDALDMRHRSQIAAWCAERGLLSRTTTR